jgi:hypothetical protein
MATPAKPLLHLVFGGEVRDPSGTDFVDASKLDVVGLYPNYATALKAWKGASMAQIDNASFKYVIVHLHRLMDPEHDTPTKRPAKPAAKPAAKRKK